MANSWPMEEVVSDISELECPRSPVLVKKGQLWNEGANRSWAAIFGTFLKRGRGEKKERLALRDVPQERLCQMAPIIEKGRIGGGEEFGEGGWSAVSSIVKKRKNSRNYTTNN